MTTRKERFSDNFWSEDEQGFQVLMERMKAAKHTCTELHELFKLRADMEEDYARKLLKVVKAGTLGKEESDGTLRTALDALHVELEAHAKSRLTLAEEIRTKLEKPMQEFLNKQRDARKEHQGTVEKSMKLRSNQIATVNKSEERYRARCQEFEQLQEQKKNVKTKEFEKLDAKVQKAQASMKQSDQEYQAAVERLQEIHILWVKDMNAACEEFQKLEEERMEYTRNILWTYANCNSSACVTDDQTFEEIRKALEKCNVTADLNLFIETRRTGTVAPAPLQYQSYSKGGEKGGVMSRLGAMLPGGGGGGSTSSSPSQTASKSASPSPPARSLPNSTPVSATPPSADSTKSEPAPRLEQRASGLMGQRTPSQSHLSIAKTTAPPPAPPPAARPAPTEVPFFAEVQTVPQPPLMQPQPQPQRPQSNFQAVAATTAVPAVAPRSFQIQFDDTDLFAAHPAAAAAAVTAPPQPTPLGAPSTAGTRNSNPFLDDLQVQTATSAETEWNPFA